MKFSKQKSALAQGPRVSCGEQIDRIPDAPLLQKPVKTSQHRHHKHSSHAAFEAGRNRINFGFMAVAVATPSKQDDREDEQTERPAETQTDYLGYENAEA